MERNYQQQELRDSLDAMDLPALYARCKEALGDTTLLPELAFWYSYFAFSPNDTTLDFKESEKHVNRCFELAAICNSDLLKAWAAYSAAGLNWAAKNYDAAAEYCMQCRQLLDHEPDNECILRIISVEAITRLYQTRYDEAISTAFKGLRLAEDIGNKYHEASFAGILGNILMQCGPLEDSIAFYRRAIAIWKNLAETKQPLMLMSLAGELSNVGLTYRSLNKHNEAKSCYEEALSIIENTTNYNFHTRILNNLAGSEIHLKDFELAEQHAKKAIAIATEAKNDYMVSASLHMLGYLFIESGHFSEALTWLAQAEKNTVVYEAEDEKDRMSSFARAYAGLGDYENAYKYHLKEMELMTKFAKAESSGEVKYREHIQKELAEKIAENLRLRERELANTASSLAAQTELLGDFRAALRKIVLRPDKYEPEEIIKQVRAKLKELPCEMIDFGKFEAQFATVHPEFRAKLETKYPDLTPQEVKICMLLHVNLKSAAIARLICVSERGVENHRFNIRKKLSLKTEDSLTKFLQEL